MPEPRSQASQMLNDFSLLKTYSKYRSYGKALEAGDIPAVEKALLAELCSEIDEWLDSADDMREDITNTAELLGYARRLRKNIEATQETKHD